MNSISPLAYIIQPLIAVGWVFSILFLINYGTRSKWRSTTGGKLFFYAYSLNTALLTLNGASYFFEDYPFRDVVRIFVYASLALNAVLSNVVLVLKQRENMDAVRAFVREMDPTLMPHEVREVASEIRRQYKANPEAFKSGKPSSSDK